MAKKSQIPRSAGYIRVDPEMPIQAAREQQQFEIAQFARRHGYQHVADAYDTGWSRNPHECQGFKELIEMARQRRFSKLLVWKLDRLPGEPVAALDLMIHLYDEFGVTVRSITEPIDSVHSHCRAFARAVRSIGDTQRRAMADVRRQGKREKARLGALAGGAVPLGYKLDDSGELVVDPEAARIVRRIYGLRAKGDSLRTIATILNAEGLPTRRGGKWHAGTVRYVLENPKYRGYVSYNFNDNQGLLLTPAAHPAIIS